MSEEERPAPGVASPSLGTIALPTMVLMTLVAAVMGFVLLHQVSNYERLLAEAKQPAGIPGPVVLALSRSLDAAVMKTCCVFIAFLLVFLGGLYTLRVTESAYRLSVEAGHAKGVLETASPGLVMLTLGAALICVTVLKDSSISLESGLPSQPSPREPTRQSASQTVSTATHTTTMTAGPKSQTLGCVPDDDLKTLNTAFAIIAPEALWGHPADRKLAEAVRARLDTLRRAVALARYPDIAGRYAQIAEMRQSRPVAFSALDPHEREQFDEVERLLGLTLSTQGR